MGLLWPKDGPIKVQICTLKKQTPKLANMPKCSNQHAQICAPTQSTAAGMLNVSR